MRGNVMDLAVGVIIGSAFGKIVSSLVSDIIMPPIGLLLGGMDFKDLKWVLREAPDGTPLVALNYGNFIQNIVDFLIIALAIFFVVKLVNRLQKLREKEEQSAPPTPPRQEQLLTEIRDLLKEKKQI